MGAHATFPLLRFAALCLAALVCALLAASCDNMPSGQPRDPNVVPNERDYEENPKLLSPPTLGYPIYACSSNVTIANFIRGARLDVFIDGVPAPNPSKIGGIPELGENFELGTSLAAGKTITVTQTYDGVTSDPSNAVMVTSHTADYPGGLPKPRLFKHPLRQCGHAVLVEDVVPGSIVSVSAENRRADGSFEPAVQVGGFNASTNWGINWTGVSPEFKLDARISAQAKLCTDTSLRSDIETPIAPPAPMPAAKLAAPLIEGQDLVTIIGAGASPADVPISGPIIRVYRDGSGQVGESAIPGGVPHTMGLSANVVAGANYRATQTLCTESNPGDSPTTPALPCSEMPAPKIKPPIPGDTQVIVTEHQPGAEILVFVGSKEIGRSGGNVIVLSQALKQGDVLKVMQRIGKCMSPVRYQLTVDCSLGDAPRACSGDWPAFRHNGLRNAQQPNNSVLADPYKVKALREVWRLSSADGGQFTASPIVWLGRLYIGTSAGRLYAYDAVAGGAPLWQYPPAGEPALTSQWGSNGACANPSSSGIAATPSMAQIDGRDVIILAAPDRGRPTDPGGVFASGLGSGRLFAIDAGSGALIWKSGEVARMTGLSGGSTSEFHEQIGYSAPLVLGSRVYVGVANHCDNPIQNGRVRAVELASGALVPDATFSFSATSDRGGGVWTYLSGGLAGAIVTTTGNTNIGGSEPRVNHGLSMIRLNPGSGALEGKLQPVPYVLDRDPDWSAGAALMATSCGAMAASTMKDGWSYGARLGPPLTFAWQYPFVAYPFPAGDQNDHGDIRYHRAGAAWGDLYVTMTGGEDTVHRESAGETFAGYQRLHALNVCNGGASWIADLSAFTSTVTNAHSWALGPPSVTRGIFYVGTNRGFIIALADPSVWPANGSRCTFSHLDGAACTDAGFRMVPRAAVLKAIDLGAGRILRTEPVIANGSLYVATESGVLVRLAPP